MCLSKNTLKVHLHLFTKTTLFVKSTLRNGESVGAVLSEWYSNGKINFLSVKTTLFAESTLQNGESGGAVLYGRDNIRENDIFACMKKAARLSGFLI